MQDPPVFNALHLDRLGAPGAGTDGVDPVDLIGEGEIIREHWVWRGLPFAARRVDGDGDETWDWVTDALGSPPRRLFAADLPALEDRDLDHSEARQRATPEDLQDWDRIGDWETIIGLGDAFVSRQAGCFQWQTGDWNLPATPGGADASGTPGARLVQVFEDRRQDRGASDYHRYRVVLRSRYAPILRPRSGVVEGYRWRRLWIPYEGPPPAPPIVLAVLPLIRGLAAAPETPGPRPGARESAPLLVLVDHVAFKEHGLAERLSARLVPDIVDGEVSAEDANGVDGGGLEIEGTTDDRPYRVGPVADVHRLQDPDSPYWGTPATRLEDVAVWGPFGTTFETIDDEARISASAYVLFPPQDIAPHTIAEVVLERAVHAYDADGGFSPVDGLVSTGTARRQLFFPAIAPPGSEEGSADNDEPVGTLSRSADQGGELVLRSDALPVFHPWRASRDQGPAPFAESHRYVALLARVAVDSAGGIEVPLPFALYRVRQDGNRVLQMLRFSGDQLPSLVEGERVVAYFFEVRLGMRCALDGAEQLGER